ncbi:MAG: hypothetical protein JW925_12115, partial [Syntrophaceae bacterium]|nr:hypothetical protein [Syntrophaceae bacterium]
MKKIFMTLIVILLSLSLMACSSGGGNNDDSNVVSGTIGSDGGTIEVTDSSSPINGTKVIIPAGAIDSGENVKISISYTDTLPGPVNTNDPNAIAAGKVIILSKDNDYDFLLPVTVTIPYSDAQLQAGDIPSVFYWDETYQKYMSLGVTGINRESKTVTFITSHFSKFVTATIPGLAANIYNESVSDIPFQYKIDTFFHPNYGSYNPEGLKGNCFGMAAYSIWY